MVELLPADFDGILSERFCVESSFRPPSNNCKHHKADCKKKYGRWLSGTMTVVVGTLSSSPPESAS
jgi:hypothetical protein